MLKLRILLAFLVPLGASACSAPKAKTAEPEARPPAAPRSVAAAVPAPPPSDDAVRVALTKVPEDGDQRE